MSKAVDVERVIKFRYYSHFSDGSIARDDVVLTEIEDGYFKKPFLSGIFARVQFVGITDENSEEIYEGDVVKILFNDWISKSDNDSRTLEQYLDDLSSIGEIKFVDLEWQVVINGLPTSLTSYKPHGFLKVIGNIYENPELLNQ